MRDAAYIVGGYLLTAGAVTAYAVSVRLRLRRVLRHGDDGSPVGDAS